MHWLRPLLFIALVAAALGFVYIEYWPDVSSWARQWQRAMQTELARAINAIRTGDSAAFWTLLGACGAYGVAHAIGPGHGKILIAGAALATRRTAYRMAAIALAASLAQAVTAVAMVYVGLGVLTVSSGWIIGTTERVLVPISFAAMALIGAWIAYRGIRMLLAWSSRHSPAGHDHDVPHANHQHASGDHTCGPGCKHMPSAHQTEAIESWRDVVALVVSIGIRPCSGALIVLVIGWKFGLHVAGIASAFAMALGTGAVVAGVALFATTLRDMGAGTSGGERPAQLFAGAQIAAGLAVVAISATFLVTSLEAPASSGLLR